MHTATMIFALVTGAVALSYGPASKSAEPPRRSAAEVLAFKRANPCPATGERRGACPGYQVDHVIALVCGGPDSKENMQWLTVEAHREKTRYDMRYCSKHRARAERGNAKE